MHQRGQGVVKSRIFWRGTVHLLRREDRRNPGGFGEEEEMADTTKLRPLTCPFCEAHDLCPFGHNSARCEYCGGILGGPLLLTLHKITMLTDAVGQHACDCGHPEMRRLPDGVYRCPACGSEVVPV
jgi:ribosomal protein L37AE/L43A